MSSRSVFSVGTFKGGQHAACTLDNTALEAGWSLLLWSDHQAVASAWQLQVNCPHLTFSSGAELSHCEQSGNQSLFTNQLSSAPC